jgi:DNA-binding NarL/FixJ family response regulator
VNRTEGRTGDVLSLVRTVPAVVASPALRVAVLSRHHVIRAGLAQLLSRDSTRAVVVEAPVGVGHLTGHDVVVLDLLEDLAAYRSPMPKELARLLAARVPVVALTCQQTSHLAEIALAMGVSGIVHLDANAEGLLQAVERAGAGGTTTSTAYRRTAGAARAGTRLTDREISVLELVGAGLLNREIADELFLSLNTVKTYIRLAYRKIGVTRRAEAVLWAVHHDLGPRSPAARDGDPRGGPAPGPSSWTPARPAASGVSGLDVTKRPSRSG